MKEPHEWIEVDILALLQDQAEESLTQEFKGCDSLRNKKWREELAKDVSAFANSAGGTIIYGLKEDPLTHQASEIDEGYNPDEITKQSLQRIIDTRIHRRIDGIRYNVIELTTTQPGRVLFVLQIPESPLAPHMTDHKFFKRFEYESKPMEEYEVRERYRRETFPGKDVVEAWRDDAINPLIRSLESEMALLSNKQWTWNKYYQAFGGVSQLLGERSISANMEDFVGRYSDVGALLGEHDAAVVVLNEKGNVLYRQFAGSSILKEIFARSTCDESLVQLKHENPNYFKGSSPKELFDELFGTSWNEEDRLQSLAQWAINSKAEANVEPMLLFWRTQGYRFRKCLEDIEYFEPVTRARERLSDVVTSLIEALKAVRKELSERHNVPPEASQPSVNVYSDPFRLMPG